MSAREGSHSPQVAKGLHSKTGEAGRVLDKISFCKNILRDLSWGSYICALQGEYQKEVQLLNDLDSKCMS